MNRRPFLLSVCLTFLVGYALANAAQFVAYNVRYYDELQRERMIHVINYGKMGALLLKYDETRDLINRLEEARAQHHIDFFILRRGEAVVGYGSASGLAAVNIAYQPGKLVSTDSAHFLAFEKNGYLLALGISQRRADFLGILWDKSKKGFFFDISVVFLLMMGITIFFFRDIRAVIAALQKKGAKDFAGLASSSTSHEASVMIRGLHTYDTSVKRLQRDKGRLTLQMTSAIRTEMDSGKTPPYEFHCIMVRTDINRYSTICSTFPLAEFMAVVNDFFTRSSAIISAYNGYVVEFVGDEVIFYFKDEDHPNAVATALAAVRDINACAENIHAATTEKNGYAFHVKSAMASGTLHFGPQVDRYALSGGVFVETVRMLSEVEEKDQNSVYLPARLSTQALPVATALERKAVELKGIPGLSRLHRVEEFATLESALAGALTNLIFFRSATDLVRILDWARDHSRLFTDDEVKLLVRSLSAYGTPLEHESVKNSFLQLFSALEESAGPPRKLLSALPTAARAFLHPALYSGAVAQAFRAALQSEDDRLAANAVDGIIHFEPASQEEWLPELMLHENNRVAANVTLKLGMVNLSKPVIASLKRLLHSRDAGRLASGAFALGELVKFYAEHDPVFLASGADSLRGLFARVQELTQHTDLMVKRQAMRARIEIDAAAKLNGNERRSA